MKINYVVALKGNGIAFDVIWENMRINFTMLKMQMKECLIINEDESFKEANAELKDSFLLFLSNYKLGQN